MTDVSALLDSQKYVFFDGAVGTMLQDAGLKPGENPSLMSINSPGSVEKIHRMYIDAGSDIICANTFYANSFSLKSADHTPEQVISAAVEIAKRAAGGAALVALDVGPTGQILEPAGELSFEEAYANFKEIAIAGEKAGADLAAIETMSDIEELKAAMTAVSDNTKLPIFATMTFQKSGFTFMGCTPERFAEEAESLEATAVGLNCSLEPREMTDIAKRISTATKLPLIVKPNAGLPDSKSGKYTITPEGFAEQMLPFAQIGVKVIGGCCGTTPEYIKALKEAFTDGGYYEK